MDTQFSLKQTTMCCRHWNNIKWSSIKKWRTQRISVRALPMLNTYIWYKLRNSGLNSVMLCRWYSNTSRNKRWRGKGQRQNGMGVESVSVAEALSHADTLEISCHSPTRVLLPALESMERKRHISHRSYSTNVYIQNHWSTALKLLEKDCTNSNCTFYRDAVNVI